MAVQSTYSNEQRERQSMTKGKATSYLNMLRTNVPSARVEIIPDTGHFPQIESDVIPRASLSPCHFIAPTALICDPLLGILVVRITACRG
jgi:hypothetical protein